jgi:hypothetical protein
MTQLVSRRVYIEVYVKLCSMTNEASLSKHKGIKHFSLNHF